MTLNKLFKEYLPMNRKERYFTGTVFPMIVCKDNFKHFNLFISLIKDCGDLKIKAKGKNTNIQFFTEYGIKESIYDPDKARFKNIPETKDTPDILILLTGKKPTLITLEAKMYDYPKVDELKEQIRRQLEIINKICIDIKIPENRIFHYALLPKKYADKAIKENISTITWESILKKYKKVYKNDYFINILEYALSKYDSLISKGISFGKNSDAKLTGLEIYETFKKGTCEYDYIGRNKGKEGFEKDIKSGKWRTFKYEVAKKEVMNSNWIKISEFVEITNF